MKKITLLSALFVAGMATAQVQVHNSENLKVQGFQSIAVETEATVTCEKFTAESYANRFAKKANAANATYGGVDYYHADGMMHAGFDAAGNGLVPIILLPYQETTVWNNRVQNLTSAAWYTVEAPTTWLNNGEVVAENSQTCEIAYDIIQYGDLVPTPVTNDHTIQVDGANVDVKGYQYGSASASKFVIAGAGPGLVLDGNVPMTLCGMHCDPVHDESTQGYDYFMVGAGSYGNYANGTGLNINGKSMDTIGSIVRNVNAMTINQIDILVYNKAQAGIETMVPEGASIKVEIFAADLTAGKIDMSEPLYTTTITNADFTDVAGYIGTLSAKFYEVDIFGLPTETSITVDGDFYIQLTNFNESGCDFGIYSDYSPPGGTTLWTWDGEFTTLWSDGGANLLISYDAYWPTIFSTIESALVAPVEGGLANDGEYAAFALYSNCLDIDAWGEIEAPEWIEVAYSDENLATQGYLVAQFNVAALTEGTGRTGVVTFDADGYKYNITIVQGDGGPTAVEGVVAPSFNGKTYNLLGVEVDENYNGVVIKNGKKFIQ